MHLYNYVEQSFTVSYLKCNTMVVKLAIFILLELVLLMNLCTGSKRLVCDLLNSCSICGYILKC